MDNGAIFYVIFVFPLWLAIGLVCIVILIFGVFALNLAIRLAIDAVIRFGPVLIRAVRRRRAGRIRR